MKEKENIKNEKTFVVFCAMLSAFDLRKEALSERQVEAICRAVLNNAKVACEVFYKEIENGKV